MVCRSRGEHGQAILLVMIALIPVGLGIALVADGGLAYYTKTSARAAAQSAALAAIQSALDSIYQGASYTCGSQGLPCQSSPAACPQSGILYKGCLYAKANGFSSGGSQTVLVDAGTGTPPVANVTNANYWVRVQIVQTNPLTFGALSGMQSLNIGATAVAAAVNIMPLNCVVALSPSASAAVNLVGNVTLTTADCGLAVDSNSSTALSANGSTILSASSISVVGGTSTGSTSVNPTPTTGAAPFPDPLEGVPAPSVPSGCTHPSPTTASGVTTYYPGNYCGGLSFGGGANVSFSSGTYILVGGGFSVSGNATLSGSGVTFYNTFNSTYAYGAVDMAGTGNVTLSAPISGSLQGMLFFEDRNAPSGNTDTIVGNSGLNLSGAAYFPNDSFTFSGNASSQQMMLVASTVSMNGNVSLAINPESASSPITPQIGAALIE